MSDTFGAVYLSGQQMALPGGGVQGIGPFAIPASGVQDTNTWNISTSPISVGVPNGAQGVLLIPPVGGVTAWLFKTVSADTGTFLSPSLPSFVCFDLNNIPAHIFMLTGAGTTTITAQFV